MTTVIMVAPVYPETRLVTSAALADMNGRSNLGVRIENCSDRAPFRSAACALRTLDQSCSRAVHFVDARQYAGCQRD